MSIFLRTFKWFIYSALASSLMMGIAVGSYLWNLSQGLPKNIDIELDKRNEVLPTILFDRHGKQIGELFLQRRVIIPYESFPPNLIQALLASEDSRYFSHFGIDPIRMLKAALVNFEAGDFVQGASTLTQQTARLFLLSQEKKIVRKIREILLSLKMESQFNKQQIITLYLNKVFLGNAEGVEASTQGYFGKNTEELTLSESALLVGLLPAPSRYNPNKNPELAIQRRNQVLSRMAEERFISHGEMIEAQGEPLNLSRMSDSSEDATAHYVEHVRRYLIEKYGYDTLYTGGLRVYLAMDLDYQLYAQEALRHGLEDLTHRQGYQGPIKSILPQENGHLPQSEIAGSLGDFPLSIGTVVRGVVTQVDSDKEVAQIQLRGEHFGLLEWEHLKEWQRTWQSESQNYGWVQSMSDMLSVGDVIEVKIKDYISSEKLFRLKLYQVPKVNGGLIALNPSNGHVYAMSGGYDYTASEFNRSTQAVRQPGSAFKPIVYAAALDSGYTLNSRLVDSPRAYKTDNRIFGEQEIWKPKNYGNKLEGSVTLRTALVKSLNLPTIGLVEDLGPQRLINYSRQLGISANMDKNLTIGLGSFSVTLEEMVEAYGVLANRGQRVDPVFVTKIEDIHGNILEESGNLIEKIISEETAFLVTDAMRDVVDHGTGVRAKAIGRPSAGKTGTTNDSKDAWYIGFIPQLLTGVYVGYDNPKSMGSTETGSRAAAPIWVDFMKNAVANLSTEQFSQPPGVMTVKVHDSGRKAAPCDPPEQTFYEHYRVGTEPAIDSLIQNLCDSQQRLAASEAENKLEL